MHYTGGHLVETRPCIIVGGGGGGHFGETRPCVIVGGTSGRLARAL